MRAGLIAVAAGVLAGCGTPPRATLLHDLRPGEASSNPAALTWTAGRLYFFADDGAVGNEPWVSDGTEAGARLLGDLTPGPGPSRAWLGGTFLPSKGQVFFFATTPPTPGARFGPSLWVTRDGSAPTRLEHFGSCPPEGCSKDYYPHGGIGFRDGLLYDSRHALWFTDGREGRARVLRQDLYAPFMVARIPGFVVFSVKYSDQGLWATDGTAAGTRPLLAAEVDQAVKQGDRGFFVVDDYPTRGELWATDGTAAGTRVLAEMRYGAVLVATEDAVFLFDRGPSGYRLLRWNGRGLEVVQEFPGDLASYALSLEERAAVGDRLFFVLRDRPPDFRGPWVSHLWTTDGTPDGTRLLKTFVQPFEFPRHPARLSAVGSRLYFTGYDPDHGAELWSSDGTVAGTGLVADLRPGPEPSEPGLLVAGGFRAFFTADDAQHGRELWTLSPLPLGSGSP
jgi:ELWxxDGT repeat protein